MMKITEKLVSILILVIGITALGIMGAMAYGEYFEGKVYFHKASLILDANSNISATSGSTGNLTKAHISDRTRYKEIPVNEWSQIGNGEILNASSVPELVIIHSVKAIQWSVGETTHAVASFRVPVDYVSGATFKCMTSLEAASTNTTVGFKIYVNTDAVAFDSASTSQSAVAITNETTKMHDISLTVATDTFAAGDVVSLEVWRNAGTGSGALLELYNCYLSYTADM